MNATSRPQKNILFVCTCATQLLDSWDCTSDPFPDSYTLSVLLPNHIHVQGYLGLHIPRQFHWKLPLGSLLSVDPNRFL